MLQWLLSCQTTGYVRNKFSWKSCVVLCFFTWSTSCFVWWTFCDALKEGKLELFFIVYKSLLTIRRRKMGNLNGLLYWCWYREIQKKKQDESTLACTLWADTTAFDALHLGPTGPWYRLGLSTISSKLSLWMMRVRCISRLVRPRGHMFVGPHFYPIQRCLFLWDWEIEDALAQKRKEKKRKSRTVDWISQYTFGPVLNADSA